MFLEDETIQNNSIILRPKGNLIQTYYNFSENSHYCLLYNSKISSCLRIYDGNVFPLVIETTEQKFLYCICQQKSYEW